MRLIPRFRLLVPTVVGGLALALPFAAGTAAAHVEPDPATVPAGSSGVVGFTIGHGCSGSPTIEVELKVPDGFGDVSAVEIPGWTVTVGGGTVTWIGGPLDPSTPLTFSIGLTAPQQAGDYPFPIVQTCETGSIAWVEAQAPGAAEPERPVPVLQVSVAAGEPATSAQPPASTDVQPVPGSAGEAEATSGDGGPATTATSIVEPTDAVIAPAPIPTSSPAKSDGGSNTGTIVAVVIVAAVIAGGAAFVISRRR